MEEVAVEVAEEVEEGVGEAVEEEDFAVAEREREEEERSSLLNTNVLRVYISQKGKKTNSLRKTCYPANLSTEKNVFLQMFIFLFSPPITFY